MSGNGPKTTREDIEQMFELRYTHGMQPRDIADKFDVSREYVSNILTARVRKQISWPLLREHRRTSHPELIEELDRLRRENALLKNKLRARVNGVAA